MIDYVLSFGNKLWSKHQLKMKILLIHLNIFKEKLIEAWWLAREFQISLTFFKIHIALCWNAESRLEKNVCHGVQSMQLISPKIIPLRNSLTYFSDNRAVPLGIISRCYFHFENAKWILRARRKDPIIHLWIIKINYLISILFVRMRKNEWESKTYTFSIKNVQKNFTIIFEQ